MRIISGKFRGKKLSCADHLLGLRPTTDKNRESLFNLLTVGKFTKEIDFESTFFEVDDSSDDNTKVNVFDGIYNSIIRVYKSSKEKIQTFISSNKILRYNRNRSCCFTCAP